MTTMLNKLATKLPSFLFTFGCETLL